MKTLHKQRLANSLTHNPYLRHSAKKWIASKKYDLENPVLFTSYKSRLKNHQRLSTLARFLCDFACFATSICDKIFNEIIYLTPKVRG